MSKVAIELKRSVISRLEWLFVIISLLFFSGAVIPLLRADVGLAIDGSETDSVSKTIQVAVYSMTAWLCFRHRVWLVQRRSLLIVWCLLLFALLSSWWSGAPDLTSRRAIVTMGTTLFGCYMGSRFSLRQQLLMVLSVMVLLSGLSLLMVMMSPDLGIDTGPNAGAWRGVFVNKNVLARILALGFVASLVASVHERTFRVLLLLSAVAFAGAIVPTQSVTAFSVVACSPLIFFLWAMLKRPLVILPVVGVMSCVLMVTANYGATRLGASVLGAFGRDQTLTGRTMLWQESVDNVAEQPWLGHGYQAFWAGEEGPGGTIWTAVGWRAPNAHNGILDLGLELGFVGAAMLCVAYLWAFRDAAAIVAQGREDSLWAIAYLAFLVLYNVTESTLMKPNSLFWALFVGIACSVTLLIPAHRSRSSVPRRPLVA